MYHYYSINLHMDHIWIPIHVQDTFIWRAFNHRCHHGLERVSFSVSITYYYFFLCMSDVHTFWSIFKGTADPFWYDDELWHLLRQTFLFVCLFQLCSVRYGEVTSSRLCRWCVIEVTQVYFSFVSSTIQITFFWILSHFVIFVYY